MFVEGAVISQRLRSLDKRLPGRDTFPRDKPAFCLSLEFSSYMTLLALRSCHHLSNAFGEGSKAFWLVYFIDVPQFKWNAALSSTYERDGNQRLCRLRGITTPYWKLWDFLVILLLIWCSRRCRFKTFIWDVTLPAAVLLCFELWKALRVGKYTLHISSCIPKEPLLYGCW